MATTVTLTIPTKQIRGLLCSAFEGGANYWFGNLEPLATPEGTTAEDFHDGGRMQTEGDYWHWSQLLPTSGGSIKFVDTIDSHLSEDEKACVLDGDKITHGLKVMADKYPKHFADFLAENDDATTGDVFLQCCTFGEVRYS